MPAEDAAYQAIKRLVIDRTLHHYYEGKDDQLRDRLQRRFAATGLDAARYLALLENGDPTEWTDLESEITINETFFFRFAEQFVSLRDTILPALIAARATTRRLRIWSAGCSTGAEPYSVAILLHRLLGLARKDWSISILGTDLDEAALRTARSGEYGDWALRSLPLEERTRDFIPLEGGKGRRWTLRPSFLSMVRFEKHNLLDLLRSPEPALGQYDLVLCRNVLIYFQQDTVRALVRRFGASIAEDGWLLLGHAEAIGHDLPELRAISLDGTVVWRRSDTVEPPAPPPSTAIPARSAPRVASNATPTPKTSRIIAQNAPIPPAPEPARAPTDVALSIETVRDLADRGLPEAALSACQEALSRYPICPELFFYSALLLRALDRDAEAETAFRKALYVCKPFVMAHYHLGLLLNDTARPGPGRRSIAEAARIARDLPADTTLPCGDGITAGRLLALSRLDWSSGDSV